MGWSLGGDFVIFGPKMEEILNFEYFFHSKLIQNDVLSRSYSHLCTYIVLFTLGANGTSHISISLT
jgi:hypothetical protein